MSIPLFQCKECMMAVIILNGVIIRACEHTEAGILANLSAKVTGKSKVNEAED